MGIWQRWPTVSIANGSNEFTGTLTTFGVYTRPGDGISFDGGEKWYEVEALDGTTPNTKGTIVGTFAETSVVDGPVIIDNRSYRHQIPSDILEQLRRVLAAQTDLFETSGAPSALLGADKSLAFDPDARVYYYKVDGVWGDPVSLGGADGSDAGFKLKFSTSTGMSDPGSGFVRFNNATRASVTAIAIDDLSADVGTPDISNYILSWDDSTSAVRGTLILREVATPQNFAIFAITGASTENSGWTQLSVTHVVSGGTFGNNDNLTATFIRAGDAGAAGTNGVNAGLLFTLSTNTSMADPGAGLLRFNNATLASATQLAIDATSAAPGNPSVSALINTWDDSTNTAFRGTLRFMKRGAEENFVAYSVGGALTDNTGWLQVPITYIAEGGALANNDVLVVSFDRTGNTGDNGANGVSAGFEYTFSTTTTMADPSTGGVRLNNATLASVTAIAISELTAETGNPSVSAWLATFDDSTNLLDRGHVTIRKMSAKQNFAIYRIVDDNADNTLWKQLTVEHVASAGTISNADVVTLSFVRTGNAGADGDGSVDTINSVSPIGGNVTLTASDIETTVTPTFYDTLGTSINDHLAGIDAALETAGSDYTATSVASAATVDIGDVTTATVVITGTTTITSLGTVPDTLRYVRFAAALTLTYNATTLQLPGTASIVTAAGDHAVFLSDATGNWRCLSYERAASVATTAKTRTAFAATNVGASVDVVYVQGYATAFDGGGAHYKRVGSEPAHLGKVQTADGGWWAIYERCISPLMFGAVADDSTNSATAFATAQSVASALAASVVVPRGKYVVNSTISFANEDTWIFEGASVRTTVNTIKIFSGVGIADLSILGHLTLRGTFTAGQAISAPATTTEVGLYLENCTRATVEHARALDFKGIGIHLLGATGSSVYADKSKFSEVSAQNCTIGIKADAGSGGEFCTWTNPHLTGCTTGLEMSAANHTVVGGLIASNTTGIKLRDGTNHLHGIFDGTNVAHNTTNLDVLDVTLGHTFNGCHFQYGSMIFENCARLAFLGGRIDVATFQNTSGANSGPNYLRGVELASAVAPFALTGTGAKDFKLTNCFGPGATAGSKSTDGVDQVVAYRTANQTLTSATLAVVVLNAELCDNGDRYDTSTGLYVIGTAGLHEITFNIVCAGTGLTNVSYLTVEYALAATPTTFVNLAVFDGALYSTTKITFTGTIFSRLSVGDVLRLRVLVTGTSPKIGDGGSFSMMSIKCIS